MISFFSYFAVFFNIWKRRTNQLQTWIRNLMEIDEHQSLLELSLKASPFNLFLPNLLQSNVPALHPLEFSLFLPISSQLLMFLKIRPTYAMEAPISPLLIQVSNPGICKNPRIWSFKNWSKIYKKMPNWLTDDQLVYLPLKSFLRILYYFKGHKAHSIFVWFFA